MHAGPQSNAPAIKLKRAHSEKTLAKLHLELVKMQMDK